MRKHITDLLDELLVDLHQLDKILGNIFSMSIDQFYHLVVNGVLALVLFAVFDSLVLEIGVEYLPNLLDMNFAGL